MGFFFDAPAETVRIDTDRIITVIQFGGASNLSNAQDHVLTHLKQGDYEAALGLRVLVELNKEFPPGHPVRREGQGQKSGHPLFH